MERLIIKWRTESLGRVSYITACMIESVFRHLLGNTEQ